MDGSACDVENKVDTTEDAELGEADENDDEDYDYDLWHDFVGRDCEWDNKKDEDGGAGGGGRMNKTNGGVRGEVASKMPSGSANPSSTKGSGSAANKQRTAVKLSSARQYEPFRSKSRRGSMCRQSLPTFGSREPSKTFQQASSGS
ncbi:hypothetical protein Bca101_019956 [Brassica carinata]